jgi:signal transduction histidine kinase
MSNTDEQLRAELAEARQRMADMAAAQEEFLRAVSHDLRAPLRHVTSYGALVRELLQEVAQPPAQVAEALDFVATMEQSARRMAAMLDALQAISRAQRAPLVPGAVDLAAAVQAARAELAAREVGRSVQWRLDWPAHLPALQADQGLLVQLLVQLLDNALKFTRGCALAEITVRASASAPGRVTVTVQDNGAGFDDARAHKLFGVFQRLHREAEFEGVGAGLALCRSIAERHGAALAASAQVGQGCSVRLDWPTVVV